MATAEKDVIDLNERRHAGLRNVFDRQQALTRAEAPSTLAERKADLKKFLQLVRDRQDDIIAAVNKDFGNRADHETLITEVMVLVNETKHTLKHLCKWMRTSKPLVDWQYLPAKMRIQRQPKGVVGIIGAWNFPVQLTLAPMIAALAAGNRVMLKPSELAPHSAELMKQMMAEIFDEDQVAVITGGPEVAAEFSSLPFDHLLFTGSTRVGKLIMKAASENLTPVTLELGGKSPCIIGKNAPAQPTGERVMWGKMINSGQICIAPDYVLVEESRRDEFVEALIEGAKKMYPEIDGNDQYSDMIGQRYYDRIQDLIKDAVAKGATAHYPYGETQEGEKRMGPVLLTDVNDDMQVMQEEIFGPILPIKTYSNIAGAIEYINANDRPLAMYYFGHDSDERNMVTARTHAGGVTVNDTMCHMPQGNAPFGGIGASGMGNYHGKYGFDTFTHEKPVFIQSRIMRGPDLLKAPYGKVASFLLRIFIGKKKDRAALPGK